MTPNISALPLADASQSHDPAVDSRAFRTALGNYPTGVAIAAAVDDVGLPVGLTINSFASVSLAPPLVLWSIDHGANCRPYFKTATQFSINVLRAEDQEMALRFATEDAQRFLEEGWTRSDLGLPIFAPALATFECTVSARYQAGDHDILIGEVKRCASQPGDALGYRRGHFFKA